MFRHRMASAAFALCATSALTPAQATSHTGLPADTVSALHTSLSDAMARSAALGCEGRIKFLQPAVENAFDLPFVAERTLRRSWKTLDAAQREQFISALRTSFITTYATEFAKPDSVRFATGATESLANGDALVHSSLTPKNSAAITLDYVLRAQGGHWQVVNVLADGVSDLALRATQYEGVMKSDGFAALTTKLAAQTKTLKARCS